MSVSDIIKNLILEGEDVKKRASRPSSYGRPYLVGEEYETWISKCIVILQKYFKQSELYEKFIQASKEAVGNGDNYYDTMIGVLKALEQSDICLTKSDRPIDKIFISHSSNDIEYVEPLVRLLNDIGIEKSRNKIFCSSYRGYDIPLGEKIYDYLKDELNQNILVIFVLSSNYYQSVACLNEMGASWVTSKQYLSILLPGFHFSKIEGAIDTTSVGFIINDKERLNSFRDQIVSLFNLDSVESNIWEKDRERFLTEVNALAERDKYKNSLCKVDVGNVKSKNGQVELDLRLINNGKSAVVFQEVNIRLQDDKENVLEVQIGEQELEKYIIYGDERRREVFVFQNTNNNYNPRRNKCWTADVAFCNA